MTALHTPSWRVVKRSGGGWMVQVWGSDGHMLLSVAGGDTIDAALGLVSKLRAAPVLVPGTTTKD